MTDPLPLPRLGDYLHHLRRYWRRLVVLGVVGTVLGGGLFYALPQRYAASTRVAISPQLTYISLSEEQEKQPLVTLDTAAEMLRSDRVLAAVGRAMGRSRDEAAEAMEISATPLSRVLVVRVNADSRAEAEAGAVAAAESLRKLQKAAFDPDRDRVRQLKRRVAVAKINAQQQLSDGTSDQRALNTLAVLETRLERVRNSNLRDNDVLVRAIVFGYRSGQLDVMLISGLALGLLIAAISPGRVRAARDLRPPRRPHAQPVSQASDPDEQD